MQKRLFDPGAGPLPRRVAAEEVLESVLRQTEASFVTAGNELVASVDLVRGLAPAFDRLAIVLGADAAQRLGGHVAAAQSGIRAIGTGLDDLLATTEALRGAVRGVRVAVADLDRVVRTISNVSINARIQGNGLRSARHLVAAFIERLAGMAAEAEAILSEMRAAMDGIGAEMSVMDEGVQDLREALGLRVMPALARFDRMARTVLDGQAAQAETTRALAARMAAIDAEVSRLVIGLQTGDATRQRLERVQEFLALADDSRGVALQDALLDLAGALVEAAVTEGRREVTASARMLEALRKDSGQVVAQARDFYLSGGKSGDTGAAEAFAEGIAGVRARLGAMRDRAATLGDRLGAILQHEPALRAIGHRIRLSGLNAVVICARLGDEGRSLRELAQWLRVLTDESDTIVQGLQQALAATDRAAGRLGGQNIPALDRALSDFFAEAEPVARSIIDMDQAGAETARLFDATARRLPERLGLAGQSLAHFQTLLGELDNFDMALAGRRSRIGEGDALSEADVALLDQMRRRYTTEAERKLHDSILLPRRGQAMAEPALPMPSSTLPPEPAGVAGDAGDGLDDILF